MKKLLTAMSLSVVMMGSAAAAVNVPKYDVKAGEAKFAPCTACHGTDGNSPSPAFPRIAGQHASYVYKQLQDFKSGKRDNATMAPQVANLSEQDMADLAGFISQQKAAVGSANPDTVVAAEKLFRGGDSKRGIVPCAGCHGPSGNGNPFAVFPKIGGQYADYTAAQLKAFRAAGRDDEAGTRRTNDAEKQGDVGMMQMVAGNLSDKDIKILSDFISGLHR